MSKWKVNDGTLYYDSYQEELCHIVYYDGEELFIEYLDDDMEAIWVDKDYADDYLSEKEVETTSSINSSNVTSAVDVSVEKILSQESTTVSKRPLVSVEYNIPSEKQLTTALLLGIIK